MTTFTDPSWTPLFVSIEGLVTEVGRLDDTRRGHRPKIRIVGVQNAAKLFRDGQRIHVHGTESYVEIL